MTHRQYCNMCGFDTVRKNEKEDCPYHQEVTYSEDGEPIIKYDEFNAEGEEW